MLRLYDTARRAKVDFVPRVEGRVSMYVCGPTPVRRAAPRSRSQGGRVRHDPALPPVARLRGDVREQRHRHRGQDHRPGPARRARPSPSWSPKFEGDVPERVRPPEHPAPRRRAPRDRVDRGDDRRSSPSSSRRGHAYVVEGQGRLLPGRHAARLRRALAPHARRAARERRRTRRRRRAQARAGRLRALEDGQAGRAGLGLAVGSRAVRAGTSSARRCR